MRNTGLMESTQPNGPAPTTSPGANKGGTFRMGAKGGKGAQAWQCAWDRLSRTEWTRSDLLVKELMALFDLKRTSIVELLSRMRMAGFLEQKMIPVATTYARGKGYTANRPRVHYRIAAEVAHTASVPEVQFSGAQQ